MSSRLEVQAFQHHDVETMQDPYPFYREARGGCPVARSDELGGFYYALTHGAAKTVLSDFAHFTSTDGVALPAMPSRMLPIDLDPPRQTRFRRALHPFFSPEAAERSRPLIEAVVNGLIDAFAADGHADLAAQLTRPTITGFLLPLIGVPPGDRAALTAAFDFVSNERTLDPERFDREAGFIDSYLMGLIAARRGDDAAHDDYIAFIMANDFEGKPLDDREIFQVLLVTLFGALDTTHAASNAALLHLARSPADKARLLNGEVDWGGAVEEFVRFSSPIQFLRRTVREEVEVAGVRLPAGAPILAGIAPGNRDPAIFEDPETCLIARDAREHLGFGAGAHVCLGRNFARIIVQTVLRAMLTRLPDYAVAPDFTPLYTAGEGRRMRSLPVTFIPQKTRRKNFSPLQEYTNRS